MTIQGLHVPRTYVGTFVAGPRLIAYQHQQPTREQLNRHSGLARFSDCPASQNKQLRDCTQSGVGVAACHGDTETHMTIPSLVPKPFPVSFNETVGYEARPYQAYVRTSDAMNNSIPLFLIAFDISP